MKIECIALEKYLAYNYVDAKTKRLLTKEERLKYLNKNPKFLYAFCPQYCEQIGYIERLFQWLHIPIHTCDE